MTGTRRARPGGEPGTGSNTQLTGGGSTSDATAYVAGVRRRRSAAWRCRPLQCGRRDPLDPLAGEQTVGRPASPELLNAWRAAAAVGGWWALPAEAQEHLAAAS